MEIRGLNRGDRQGRDRTWRAYDTDKYCPGNDGSNAQLTDNDENQERTHEIEDLLAVLRGWNVATIPALIRGQIIERRWNATIVKI